MSDEQQQRITDSAGVEHDRDDPFTGSDEGRDHPDPLTWGDVALIMDDVNFLRETLAIGDGTIPELPKGKPGDAHRCVLALALSNGWAASVDGETIVLKRPPSDKPLLDDDFDFDGTRTKLQKRFSMVEAYREQSFSEDGYILVSFGTPEYMNKLIGQFDAFLLPELILED